MDEEGYQMLLGAYRECIVRIIENGYLHEFEEGDISRELQGLWEEIYKMCLNILSSSINLIYSNTQDIVKNLESTLNNTLNVK